MVSQLSPEQYFDMKESQNQRSTEQPRTQMMPRGLSPQIGYTINDTRLIQMAILFIVIIIAILVAILLGYTIGKDKRGK